ncbi:MAG: hypothetical protein J0H84_19640 [Rhizobiales bacterium]|jgi:hypothetical protein|nr:hypothetical protein [Hyphomicrobiales bacterium]
MLPNGASDCALCGGSLFFSDEALRAAFGAAFPPESDLPVRFERGRFPELAFRSCASAVFSISMDTSPSLRTVKESSADRRSKANSIAM